VPFSLDTTVTSAQQSRNVGRFFARSADFSL
jgi:hypothetical protein